MANSLTATRQAREREVLPKLYNMLSRDHAVKTTADNVANRVGIISKPQMVTFAGKLEELGIIGREYRLDGQGKASYWKLLVPFKTAEAKLESSHREELQPITKNSLKARILRAIEEKGKFDNTIDLINYIKGERKAAPDPHEVTHILHSLKRAGYIRFRRSNHPEFNGNGARKGKDIVPVNIVLQRRAAKATAMVEPVEAVIDDPEPGAIVAPIMVIPEPSDFPLIRALVNHTTQMENLARMAETAGQDDIAVMLYDRAKITDPLQLEMIELWNKYQECQNA